MKGMWRHESPDELYCDDLHLRPDNEIDDPRCHCGTQTEKHASHCSAAGKPRYRATPMSQKEDEIMSLGVEQ
jgi:hypothetical protein